jgi:hypothetical protein
MCRVVLELLAENMGQPAEEIAAAAFDNASRLFDFV